MIENIRNKNPNLKIYEISDKDFERFGRVISNKSYSEFISCLDTSTEFPNEGNIYIADDVKFQEALLSNDTCNEVFGGINLQYGYCNGQNTKLNALEYHKSSEINIAATPLVLLLGSINDLEGNYYNTNNIKAFYLPEGTVVEIYPQVLHFAPCKIEDQGFKCGVILPKGTNTEFISAKDDNNQNRYLFKTNKWLLAHEECTRMIQLGAKIGIVGKNIEIKY
jgi:hypothetical protein